MKKAFTFFLTVALAVLAGNAGAQLAPKMPAKTFRALLKNPGQFPTARLAELSDSQLNLLSNRLTQATARLERHNQLERAIQARVFEISRPAIFRALSKQNSHYHALSGTLFKTTYNGQKEIFGVIPMHVLQDKSHLPAMIGKEFSVAVQTNEGFKILPAQVVQLSSSKTADVALVKLRKEDEARLSPLALSRAALDQFPKQAYAQGFAHSIITQSSFPLVGTTSTGILRARLPAVYEGERIGFCGSPVLTQNATLAGIHVGSNYAKQEEQPATDVGYITPVSFLKQLVEAYHQPALKPVVITLAGQEITSLAIDEYISKIEILDAPQNVVWSKTTEFKMTLTAAEVAVRALPQAAFVRLQIGKTHWMQDEKGWFVQDDDNYTTVLKSLALP